MRLAWLRLALVSVAICEVRIREVLAGEVHAGKVVVLQTDSSQIVGLVAGRRVELGRCDSLDAKYAPRTSAPVRFAPVSVAYESPHS